MKYLTIDSKALALGLSGGIMLSILLLAVMDMGVSKVKCIPTCVPDNEEELAIAITRVKIMGISESSVLCLDEGESLNISEVAAMTSKNLEMGCKSGLCTGLDIGRNTVNASRYVSFRANVNCESGICELMFESY
jgi:hypothetical protein